jgi:predicted RND superfamily exporter protein
MTTHFNNGGRFGEWVIRMRWFIIPATLLVVAAAASGGRFLTFSTDYRVFFSKENPQLNAFEALQNTYTKNDNAMIVIAPKNGNVFTRETLAVVEEATLAAWQIPYSTRVDSITNFQHTWADGDDLVVEDLVVDALHLSDEHLERARRVALSEPFLMNRLINEASRMTAINTTVNLPGKTLTETTEVVNFVRKMAQDIRAKHPEVDVYLTGVVFMNNAFNESGQGDMKTLVPIMYLLVIGIMLYILRSLLATVTTVMVILFSILTGMGLAGFAGIALTPVSANAPTIILTLAVADSIHLLVSMFHEMGQGRSKREAIIESLRINHQPVFITSLTTAIGFLSLNFSDSPPFWHLGNTVAMGVSAAYVYSVLFLPAMMAVLPIQARKRREKSTELLHRLADFVIQRQRVLFFGTLVVFIILGVQISRIEINEEFHKYFDTRYQFRQDNDFVTKNLTGFMSIGYSLGAGESGGISNPEYLKKLEEFSDWYRAQPGVMHVNTLTDTMKRLNKNLHGDDPAYYRIPQSRELSAQYLLLYELSLPFGLDLNNQINVDKSSTRITATLENVSTRAALDMEERAQKWLRQNAPPSMASPGASPLIMFSHIAKRNLYSMISGTFLALGLISVILMLSLKNVRTGLISMIPNMVPIFMTFGIWGMVFREVGFAVAVVAPVALGIIVDDTVHFLSKYVRARREQGKNPEDAVRYSFHTVGTALCVTSLILVAGFLVLSYSGFRMNAHLGLMTTLAILSALAADFLFLPALLVKLDKPGLASGLRLDPTPLAELKELS